MEDTTLVALHKILMQQTERLSVADGDELDQEIKRATALSLVARQISDNTRNIITASRLHHDGEDVPNLLTDGS